MSHEIRTPMNGVLGMLTLLGRRPLTEAQTHYYNLASSSARALLSIINDILDFSKIDAGKLSLELMDFDLTELISDIVESQAQRAEEKGIGLVLDMADVHSDYVCGDPGRLRQIITNLLSNALKFTHEGRVLLYLKLSEYSSGFVLKGFVDDTGIGIESDVQARLFSAFSQADQSTTREYGGTGLGLVICKELVELMGGTISLDSELGQGSCFHFSVRLGQPQTIVNLAPEFDRGRWLVLTGSEVWGKALTRQVVALGCQAEWCDSIASAVKLQESGAHDGIFLDADLAQTGWRDQLNSPWIVLMTSVTYDQGLPEGCQAFLRKPVTPKALRVMCAPAAVEQQPLTIGTLQSLAGRRLLLVEDNPVNQQVVLGLLGEMGLEVTVAENGEQALAQLRRGKTRFDLVLMDCRMPVLDGYEATRIIRSWGGYFAQMPIVALTANAMTGDREICLAAGMDDHLAKPINPELLENKLRLWLAPAATRPAIESEVMQPPTQESGVDKVCWHQEQALARVRGKPERLIELIRLFVRDTPERLDALDAAVAAQDRSEVHALAHLMKGVAGNLSALALADIAGQLQSTADTAGLDHLLLLSQQMRLAYDQASEMMTTFCGQQA